MIEVKYKKINPIAVIPFYAHDGDAGLDLCSVEDIVLEPHRFCSVKTGICIELPRNTEAQVRPRSGLAINFGITVLNSPGTIDENYRGEICVILINHSDKAFTIECGMKIAQLVVQPTYKVSLIEAAYLSDSSRGNGGFGSSGIKISDTKGEI